MSLALGYHCIIYDYGANKDVSRAVYQGVEFIKFVLSRRWFNKDTKPIVRGNDSYNYFNEVYKSLDRKTIKKVDYFKKFLMTKQLNINTETNCTKYDGNTYFYKEVLSKVI